MKHILITHANCMDGHGVALAVKYWDMIHGIEDREIYYCNYGDTPPDVTGAHVIVGDFSFPRETLIEMHDKAASLIVIDHHKTAKETLKGLDFCIFDMERSGAALTWDYLFADSLAPLLIGYIQDRDLWHWKMPKSKEISSYLQTIDFKHMRFETLRDIERWLHMENFDAMVSAGEAILNYQQVHINKIAQRKDKLPRTTIGGFHDIICINATTLISETGNALCEGEPFVAMYFDTEDKRVFSLRSCDDGEDVSLIAKQYGGGGHPRAAGFSMNKPSSISEPVQGIPSDRVTMIEQFEAAVKALWIEYGYADENEQWFEIGVNSVYKRKRIGVHPFRRMNKVRHHMLTGRGDNYEEAFANCLQHIRAEFELAGAPQ
jgi:hypothetical protein